MTALHVPCMAQTYEEFFDTALLTSARGDHSRAIELYDKALELRPEDPASINNRGACKARMGDHKGAIADYERVLQLVPDDARALHNRGRSRMVLGEYMAALRDIDRSIALQAGVAQAFYDRGNIQVRLGKASKAIGDFEEALRLQPNLAEAYHGRAVAMNMMGAYAGAVVSVDRAIALHVANKADAYVVRGTANYNLHRAEEAIMDYDMALRIDPKNTPALVNRGSAFMSMGLIPEACADWKKAAEAGATDATDLIKANCGE